MAQKGIIKNTTAAEISAENLAAVFHAIVGKSGIVKGFNDLACTKISDNLLDRHIKRSLRWRPIKL